MGLYVNMRLHKGLGRVILISIALHYDDDGHTDEAVQQIKGLHDLYFQDYNYNLYNLLTMV